MKKQLPTLVLLLIFLLGIGLLVYPTLSDWYNSFHQTKAITTYSAQIAAMNARETQSYLDAANAYNEKLAEDGTHWKLTDAELQEYNDTLAMEANGIMGYVNIPKISVTLPIYHGTGAAELQKGAGHLEGSSLPVGGESTHAVLSSHRGLVSAKLFTDLDKLQTGDTFTVTVLDQTLTYEVDQILIVLPTELSDLTIVPGEDLCTLVTCTPYGVNTHRLLVRGKRIETAESVVVPGDALVMESSLIAPLVAAPILLVLLILLLVTTRRKKPKQQGKTK